MNDSERAALVAELLALAPTMTPSDVDDAVTAAQRDPTAGSEILAAYRAAAAPAPDATWDRVWAIVQALAALALRVAIP